MSVEFDNLLRDFYVDHPNGVLTRESANREIKEAVIIGAATVGVYYRTCYVSETLARLIPINLISLVTGPILIQLMFRNYCEGLTNKFCILARIAPMLPVMVVASQSYLAAFALAVAQFEIAVKGRNDEESTLPKKNACFQYEAGALMAAMLVQKLALGDLGWEGFRKNTVWEALEEPSIWEALKEHSRWGLTIIASATLSHAVALPLLKLMNKCGLLPD